MNTVVYNQDTKASSSNRLLNIECLVCGDSSTGKHYTIYACDGCAGFFKRSIHRNRKYVCIAKNCCVIDKDRRNQCRACRLAKCKSVGMSKNAVQPERGPRTTTFQQQQQIQNLQSGALMPVQAPIHQFAGVNRYAPYPVQTLPMPMFQITPAATHDSLNERAAKLLFLNIKWLKELSTFTALPIQDQHFLVKSSWKDLFIIGASQHLNINFNDLVQAMDMSGCDNDQAVVFLQKISCLQNCVQDYLKLKLDVQEYGFLRQICLYRGFTTVRDGEGDQLMNCAQVMDIFNNAHLSLHVYVRSTYWHQTNRFTFIMDLLKSMDRVKSTIIEDLFFKETIGQVSMEYILSDMYKSP